MIPLTGAGGPSGGPWWDPAGEGLCCVAAYRAKGAASYAASKTDLTGNGNNLLETAGAVPWNAANGWSFVAAQTKALNTTVTPVNNQTWSMFVQFANSLVDSHCLTGLADVPGGLVYFQLMGQFFGNVYYANGNTRTVAPQLATGNLGVAGTQGYRNGIADGAAIGAKAGNFGAPVYIGARNRNGGIDQYLTGDVYGQCMYDCTLTAPQALSVATAMAAL